MSLAKWRSFSSSSFDHSIFRIPGSSHSDHLALHCLGVFRANSEETRAHWFNPYFDTEALRISSSMLVLHHVSIWKLKIKINAYMESHHTPPLTTGMLLSMKANRDESAVKAFEDGHGLTLDNKRQQGVDGTNSGIVFRQSALRKPRKEIC